MKFDFLSDIDKSFFIHKASTLVEALPYIRKHSNKNDVFQGEIKNIVIKIFVYI